MIPFEEALKSLLENSRSGSRTVVPLDSAQGMVLADDVHSDTDLPPSDTAACDGFAIRGDELRYEILPKESAEVVSSGSLLTGRAFPVRSGEPLPEGADRVVSACSVTVEETVILLDDAPGQGANIRSRGDGMSTGQLVLEKGTRLSQQHLGIAALAGMEVLTVYGRPPTGLLSVGEDLVPSTWRTAPGRNRDPVSPMLRGQLSCSGFTPVLSLHASSERRNLAPALDQAMGCCDVLLVIGGAGPASAVLDGMGFSFLFRMVAQEPAGSLACAMNQDGTVVFLIPDRILPAMVSAEEFVIPSLRRMAGFKGCRKRVFVGESTFDYSKEPGRQHFIGVLAYREGSDWKLHRPESAGSGYHTVTGNMNSLAIARADQLSIRSGDPLNFHFLCSAAGEMSFA